MVFFEKKSPEKFSDDFLWPQKDSNPHYRSRNPMFYPLNYEAYFKLKMENYFQFMDFVEPQLSTFNSQFSIKMKF